MAQLVRNGVSYETDRSQLRYGQVYEFVLDDDTTVTGGAYDSCVITGALFGPGRQELCWSKVVGFRNRD